MSGFDRLSKTMNDLISNVDNGFTFEIGAFSPRIDMFENDEKYFIEAEMPGVKKEDVKVSIKEDNLLVIKGEKRRVITAEDNENDSDKTIIRNERTFGEFTRSFTLPDNIIEDSINARFENGLLNIDIAKNEPAKPKEIEIQIG